ncbi:hypothetical protein D3C84_745980 [compost metagenome]
MAANPQGLAARQPAGIHGAHLPDAAGCLAGDRQRQARPQGLAATGRRAAAGVRRTAGCHADHAGADLAGRIGHATCGPRRQFLRTRRRLDHFHPGGQPRPSGRHSSQSAGSVPVPDRAQPGIGRDVRQPQPHRSRPGQRRGDPDPGAALLLRTGHCPASALEPVAAADAPGNAGSASVGAGLGGRRQSS